MMQKNKEHFPIIHTKREMVTSISSFDVHTISHYVSTTINYIRQSVTTKKNIAIIYLVDYILFFYFFPVLRKYALFFSY